MENPLWPYLMGVMSSTHTFDDWKEQTLFESMPVGVSFCTLEGLFVYTNTTHSRALGYAPDELILKRTFWDLTVPADHQESRIAIASGENFGRFGWIHKSWYHAKGGIVRGRIMGKLLETNGAKYMIAVYDFSSA